MLGGQAFAVIINVPGDQPTIQAGISASIDGDEVLVAAGTYFETIDLLGKAITVRSSGGPEVTIIDGQLSGRVVTCERGEGPDTVVEGFTITSGLAQNGAGMGNLSSSPTVNNCVFIGNQGTFAFGGGMLNNNSSPRVTNCTFIGNIVLSSFALGGGMANLNGSNPLVANCAFIENHAGSPGSPAFGGGMYNDGSAPTVTNCTFSGNSVETDEFGVGGGGGMYNVLSSTPTVTNCILWGNGESEILGDQTSAATARFSDIQGGWFGNGSNNIDADPLFADPISGDYRLSSGSPCVDAGDNGATVDITDTDLDGNPRFVDDPATPDTGNGDPPVVDMGAYEFDPCPWDCQAAPTSGAVDVPDLLALLAAWGGPETPGTTCDLDDDGLIAVPDLLQLLANWGPCPP